MSPETANTETTFTLGELLRKKRSERGLDLQAIAAETRISPTILQAMEDGDYPSLPADAFTRGFYSLYAQALQLDTGDILRMYDVESSGHPNLNSNNRTLPGTGGGEVMVFAERPRSVHFTSIGFFLILLILFGAFLCWYFSWNPATFLSQKLRGYQQNPQQAEQTLDSNNKAPAKIPPYKLVKVTPRKSSSTDAFSMNSMIEGSSYPPNLEE